MRVMQRVQCARRSPRRESGHTLGYHMHRPVHRNIQVHGGNVGRPPLSGHIHAAPHRGTERGRTPRSRRRDFRQRRSDPHRRYAIASAHRRRSAAGVAATCEPPRLRISDTPICHSGIAGGRRRSRPYAHPCEPPRLRTSGTPICDKHRRHSTAQPPLARFCEPPLANIQ